MFRAHSALSWLITKIILRCTVSKTSRLVLCYIYRRKQLKYLDGCIISRQTTGIHIYHTARSYIQEVRTLNILL